MQCVFLFATTAVHADWPIYPDQLPAMPNTDMRCSMWGHRVFIDGFWKLGEYTGPPLQLLHEFLDNETRSEVINILATRCPNFLYDDEGNRKPDDEIYTCCSSEQVQGVAQNFLLADSVLGRCPTCLRNFVRQICEMNCAPDQGRFVDAYAETTVDGLAYINEVDYRMHEDFMLGAHSACVGVIVPQTGLPAINLMCGDAAVCDAEAWFGFSGDVQSNPFAPTQTNFLRWPTTEDSMNVRALPCNETFEGDFPCSCMDCLSTCPTGQEFVVPDICTVLSVNCTGFAIGISFFVVSVLIFTVLTLVDYKRTHSNCNQQTKPDMTSYEYSALTKFFKKVFESIGQFSASKPMVIILFTTWVAFAMFFGLRGIKITAAPIEIWSAPGSRSREDFNYFNSRFGPFYRAAQVFLTVKDDLDPLVVNNVTYGRAFRFEVVKELITLEDAIINIGRDDNGVTLEEVCYAPLRVRNSAPNLDLCVTFSVGIYLGDDRNNLNEDTYLNKILNCLNNFYGLDCMASWGGGSEPELTFGGYEGEEVLTADTLVINFPITNYLYEDDLIPVLEWEQKFIDLMHDYKENWKSDFIDVSFGAERSIEDEIQRVSEAEVVPIAASYVLMFVYVTLALGKFRACKSFLVGSKVLVAVGSILIEILAIYCALATMGYFGMTTTLLAINVIPFFVLSVGIDNVFLMVNTLYDIKDNLKQYPDYNENASPEKKKIFIFGKMMERVGPSIFVTSITQITCFAIGTTANFPAVVTFAIFATFALAYLFILQITTVVALISLDYNREMQNRLDIFFCIQKKILDDTDPLTSAEPHKSLTQRLMGPYSKFIVNWKVKICVAIIFMAIVSISVILIPQLEIGLDQQMALPTDSYVYKYLRSVNELLKLGPPVFFVLKAGLNFSDPVHQNTICGGQLCNSDSLTTQIFLASLNPEVTHISRSSNSWIDDFFDWSSLTGSCCKYNVEDNSFCQSTNTSSACAYCTIEMDDNGIRPSGAAFERYFPFFLQDAPTEMCNKGGLASYFSNVNYLLDEEGRATIYDSNFMAYHTALGTSEEYITAVKYGYEISENITRSIQTNTGLSDVEVFPYSVFYPFYEQYLSMWSDTFASIGYSLIGVLLISLLASGFNFLTTFAVMFTTILVVLNMMGMMYLWNIPLNAVSCVNLIVSIGISVEFCSHIAYAFATSSHPPRDRVSDALKQVGATIITGITLTNIPIIVLAFSYTELIEVFFFRMFFGLVIVGFFHGMVFLPVLLSFLTNFTNKS